MVAEVIEVELLLEASTWGNSAIGSDDLVPSDIRRVAFWTPIGIVADVRSTVAAFIQDRGLSGAEDSFQSGCEDGHHSGLMTSWQLGHSAHTDSSPSLVSYSIRTWNSVISLLQ